MERIYGIYDRTAGSLLVGGGGIKWVMIYSNDAVARRDFTGIVRQVPHIAEHAGDYCLMTFGEIDLTIPKVTPEPPRLIMNAIDALHTDPRQNELPLGSPAPVDRRQTAADNHPDPVLENQNTR